MKLLIITYRILAFHADIESWDSNHQAPNLSFYPLSGTKNHLVNIVI